MSRALALVPELPPEPSGEPAGIWIRVSSGGQSEALQMPDVMGHIERHGYHVAKRYVLHDKSAFKGEQQATIDLMLSDMRAGLIKVLVVWHSDRLDRRGPRFAWATVLAVELAGGRIESVKDPEFGGDSVADETMTGLRMSLAREESKHKMERQKIAQDAIHEHGGLDGKPPWGFLTGQGEKLSRPLIPTEEAREYIPQIYQRVIAGQSLGQIARWLTAEGVKPYGIRKDREDGRGKTGKWWPGPLGAMVKNPVYMGMRVARNGAITAVYEPPLVNATVWHDANEALKERPKRGPVLKENRSYLSGAARCFLCGGPMYRIRGFAQVYNLRCAGTGPDRKSCTAPANAVKLETAEQLADEVLGSIRAPVLGITIVRGNKAEIKAQLARLDFERKQLAQRGLPWDEEDRERARIRAEWERVNATERTPDHREIAETGESHGERWMRLSVDERADWLRSEVTVSFLQGEHAEADAFKDGVSIFWQPTGMNVLPDN